MNKLVDTYWVKGTRQLLQSCIGEGAKHVQELQRGDALKSSVDTSSIGLGFG